MVDDRSNVLPSVAELEELHDVEELAEDDATGEFSRPQLEREYIDRLLRRF